MTIRSTREVVVREEEGGDAAVVIAEHAQPVRHAWVRRWRRPPDAEHSKFNTEHGKFSSGFL